MWNKVIGNDCVPKIHMDAVTNAAQVAAEAAAGYGWCFAINTFPIATALQGVMSPIVAAAYCGDLRDGTWAYVHADADGVPNNKSTW